MNDRGHPSKQSPLTGAVGYFFGLAVLLAVNIHEFGRFAVGAMFWSLAWNGAVGYLTNRPIWWVLPEVEPEGYGKPLRILMFLGGLLFLAISIEVSFNIKFIPRFVASSHYENSQR